MEGGLESSLEIVAPATSDVEFKYTWPIDSFLHQVCTQTVYDVNEVKTEAHKVLFDRLKKNYWYIYIGRSDIEIMLISLRPC